MTEATQETTKRGKRAAGRRPGSAPPATPGDADSGPPLLFELNADEAECERRVQETSYRGFMPHRIGPFAERFHDLARALGESGQDRAEAKRLIEEEIAWARDVEGRFGAKPPKPLRRYQAALCVLADLVGQDWAWRYRGFTLELAPPDFTNAPRTQEDVARQKAAIRDAMQFERLAQLQVPSVRRFLEEMERPAKTNGRTKRSILDLVRDGDELASALRQAARQSGDDYLEALRGVCRPYLQLAENGERCKLTGLRLIDIWRYFRYYWSIPYFSTPGRNLFYLVRDAARPLHPVIGIAALGNSIVRLADRERHIGWDVESVALRVEKASPEERDEVAASIARHLYETIVTAAHAVDPTGLVEEEQLDHPSQDVVVELLNQARISGERRKESLRRHERQLRGGGRKLPQRKRPLEASAMMLAPGSATTLADESVEHLFVQKRAAKLAELLRAQLTFVSAGVASDPSAALFKMLENETGRRAIATAITTIKQHHIGTSIMDIIICGAIPPYSHLLGGKLVCMLLASAQVRLDYHERYSGSPSEIASKMRGAQHAKPAELVFLGTTSLYHVGSSQYNRIKIPAADMGGSGAIRYQRIGTTRGYGSVHFSARTRELLEEAVRDEHGATFITRTFGEGVSPKLRLVREGLSTIGVDQDHFLRHQCRRIIYGVELAQNTKEFLRDEADQPKYFLPAETAEDGKRCSEAIAEYWTRRWLAPRARREDVLHRVAVSTVEQLRMTREAEKLQLSSNGRSVSDVTAAPLKPRRKRRRGGPPSGDEPEGIGVRFIQQLYNHRSCYADRLTPEQLDAIHIETPLEAFVVDTLRSGRDVVLTGNPGDGKTHLIMRLGPALDELGAVYHADATAEESYEKLVELWRKARRRKKPFCLAINEWPLLELVREHADRFRPLREVREQIQHGLVYEGDGPAAEMVVVLDLDNRNLVDRDVFDRLVQTLTSDRFYPECRSCPALSTCDVPKARRALQVARVRERLFTLLELVTKRGAHVTMRDLQGFVAFLIAGGRSCEELINAVEPRPYYSLVFEGESDLFDAIVDAFDPARITHPLYDEALWTGTLPTEGWTDLGAPIPPVAASGDRIEAMRAAKRRFFFEHEDGLGLADLLPQDERRFFETLSSADDHPERVIRGLVRLINRFFDPRDDTDGALRLWSRHRFDARWSPTYVSTRSVPIDVFSLQVPRLPATTRDAHAYQPDHVVLAAQRHGETVARLTVDLSLYRTLFDAQRGLPMALRSGDVLKRIDVFFNELGRAFTAQREIEDVHIKNFESGEELRFKVDRGRGRYSI